ncbi:hypothetical protein CEUSTIGMA_g3935.t1 [Chlamydomonas eustigma]|uniref:Uncharacterized protein n=1 Tax=Chlamydomonas eustigma TaxID=1157962 RepID=A0A250X167_9CHLO|nr:hypothetical protein CEUSTIGMA_g3935.t1 [Chlamydomonas eustigma]|eukprot:GAX76490.1 hypothetical protein CEUSTIGMA_g3935.t1 [Chlamydomonas eustigma]
MRMNTRVATSRTVPRHIHFCNRIFVSKAMSQGSPAELKLIEKRSDLLKGCKTILQELKGLGFSRFEARLYFKLSTKLPKDISKDFNIARAQSCLEQIEREIDGSAGSREALQDIEAMQATQAMLSEIWRWKRRGGGSNEEDDLSPPHQQALREIQNLQKEDIDRITSSILDTLPISDKEKNEMAGAVEQVALGGINGAVWGSLVMTMVFLVLFNFIRPS